MRLSGDARKLIERMSSSMVLGNIVGDDAYIWDAMENGSFGNADFLSAERTELRRSEVRFIAALFPKVQFGELSDVVFDILDSDRLTRQDVRLILGGYSLHDASKRLNDTPIEVVQKVGEMLSEGCSQAEISRTIRVSEDTVYRIDRFLGLSDAWRMRKVQEAGYALEDGLSVREFGRRAGLSKSTAHRMMQEARSVSAELDNYKEGV